MLNIRRVKHLAASTDFSVERLHDIVESVDSFCEELILLDPTKPEKRRMVLNVRGDLRKFQERLLRSILMPRLTPSAHSHGGIIGRHIKTNVAPHLGSVFVFTADISNFYPTISHNRVYRLFSEQFGCTPDVARICTRLTTYRHHLALGLVTSPFIAEQVILPADHRIAAACHKAGLKYSRFVDDISISGTYDLRHSGFESVVSQIVCEHGFRMHADKVAFGRLSDGATITKITVKNGHPDVRREFLKELDRQFDDVNNLASGRKFIGPYFTKNQIYGRVQFVCWINPGRRHALVSKFNAIPWNDVARAAAMRGLVVSKTRLVKEEATQLLGLRTPESGRESSTIHRSRTSGL